jgi:hypothetical protein
MRAMTADAGRGGEQRKRLHNWLEFKAIRSGGAKESSKRAISQRMPAGCSPGDVKTPSCAGAGALTVYEATEPTGPCELRVRKEWENKGTLETFPAARPASILSSAVCLRQLCHHLRRRERCSHLLLPTQSGRRCAAGRPVHAKRGVEPDGQKCYEEALLSVARHSRGAGTALRSVRRHLHGTHPALPKRARWISLHERAPQPTLLVSSVLILSGTYKEGFQCLLNPGSCRAENEACAARRLSPATRLCPS